MPQVPYSPVPTVAPTEVATPSERVSTPLEAFGGGVAAATEGLGKSVSGVGDELFARAVALQELNNETDAKNANVDFIGKAGDLHAKYNALQGQARVAAFPQYQKDLQTLYQTSRGSLSNPSAQRMFDGAAISTLNRSVFNAAGSAATAQSEAALGAANAEFETTVKGVYNDPNDQGAYDDAIAKSDKAAVTKAALSPGGASPERVAYIQQQGRSTITYNRVVGMAADEPNKAYQFLKEAEAKGMIFGAQDTEALAKVRSFIHSVGMNTVANQTLAKYTQPDGTYSKSVQDMSAEAVATATKMYPEDPAIATSAEQALKRNFSTNAWNQSMDERARKQELSTYIVKGVTDPNMLPPALLQRMTPGEIKAYPAEANSYRRSIDTQTNQVAHDKLLGLYTNDNAAFMEKNFMTEPGLNQSNRDYFLKLQRQENANGDPRVSRAMSTLKGYSPATLDDLGVTGKNRDPDVANHFVGALHDAIQSWQETNGKPPNETQLTKEIYPQLLMKVTDPNAWFGGKTELFRAGLPSDLMDKATAQKGSALTTDETESLRHDYNRLQFDKLFGARAKSQERVP